MAVSRFDSLRKSLMSRSVAVFLSGATFFPALTTTARAQSAPAPAPITTTGEVPPNVVISGTIGDTVGAFGAFIGDVFTGRFDQISPDYDKIMSNTRPTPAPVVINVPTPLQAPAPNPQIIEAHAKIDGLKAQIENKNREIESKKIEIANLQSQNAALGGQNAALSTQITGLQTQLSQLTSQRDALQQSVTDLNKKNDILKQQNTVLSSNLDNQKQATDDAQQTSSFRGWLILVIGGLAAALGVAGYFARRDARLSRERLAALQRNRASGRDPLAMPTPAPTPMPAPPAPAPTPPAPTPPAPAPTPAPTPPAPAPAPAPTPAPTPTPPAPAASGQVPLSPIEWRALQSTGRVFPHVSIPPRQAPDQWDERDFMTSDYAKDEGALTDKVEQVGMVIRGRDEPATLIRHGVIEFLPHADEKDVEAAAFYAWRAKNMGEELEPKGSPMHKQQFAAALAARNQPAPPAPPRAPARNPAPGAAPTAATTFVPPSDLEESLRESIRKAQSAKGSLTGVKGQQLALLDKDNKLVTGLGWLTRDYKAGDKIAVVGRDDGQDMTIVQDVAKKHGLTLTFLDSKARPDSNSSLATTQLFLDLQKAEVREGAVAMNAGAAAAQTQTPSWARLRDRRHEDYAMLAQGPANKERTSAAAAANDRPNRNWLNVASAGQFAWIVDQHNNPVRPLGKVEQIQQGILTVTQTFAYDMAALAASLASKTLKDHGFKVAIFDTLPQAVNTSLPANVLSALDRAISRHRTLAPMPDPDNGGGAPSGGGKGQPPHVDSPATAPNGSEAAADAPDNKVVSLKMGGTLGVAPEIGQENSKFAFHHHVLIARFIAANDKKYHEQRIDGRAALGYTYHLRDPQNPNAKGPLALTIKPDGVTIHAAGNDSVTCDAIKLAVAMYDGDFTIRNGSEEFKQQIATLVKEMRDNGELLDKKGGVLPHIAIDGVAPEQILGEAARPPKPEAQTRDQKLAAE